MGITAGGMIILLALSGGLPEIMWLGEEGLPGSAAALGMGNTVFADASPQASIQNPAMASKLPEGFTAGVTGAVALNIEKRTRRVYDSFGGLVGESEHSFNQNFYPMPGGAVLSLRQGSLAVSAGWRTASNFAYDYCRVMNDDNYVKVGEETLDISGILNDFGIAGSWAGSDAFSIGAGGSFITGNRSLIHTIEYVDPTVAEVRNETETDISGLVIRGSALLNLSRLCVSGGIEQPVSWKSETLSLQTDLALPLIIRAGLRYIPGNRLMSFFAADFWWSGTSSVEINNTDAGLSNSWGFGAGVENTLPGSTVARVGFEYDSSPLAEALSSMKFTTGIGWHVGDLTVDAGLSFSPARWDQYQAPGLPSFVTGDSLVVESSRTVLTLGVAKTF
jgi:hypothetical protein